MKEIPLRELMSMADPDAHEGIGELWNQKTIHYLVVFTSADADFEIIGVGPTLPYATLEAAGQHHIPGKMAEYYIKCPGAIAGRLQPKLAPGPRRSATPSPLPAARSREQGAGSGERKTPIMEDGKRKMEETAAATPVADPATPCPKLETQNSKPETISPAARPATATPVAQPATCNLQPATPPDLAAREKAIGQREQELAALFDSLKIREASLRERETAIAAMEERLLNPTRKSE